MRTGKILHSTALYLMSCPALAAPVGFDRALDLILERSTSVGIQQTRVQSADDVSLGKKAAFLPKLELKATQQTNSSATSDSPTGTTNSWGGITSLNLFRAGADVAARRAADADSERQRHSLTDTRLGVEQEAVEALVAQIEGQKQIDVLARQVDVFKSYLSIARQRYERGLLPLQEVDKVSIDAENVNAKLQDARTQAAAAQANVARLLGNSEIESEWPWRDRLLSKQTLTIAALPLDVSKRPDYHAALSLVQAENQRTKQYQRQLYPTLDLSYSLGYAQPAGQTAVGVNTTLLTLSLPLFEGLRDYTQYRVQQQTAYAAELRLRQLQRDAQAQWDSAKNGFETAISTVLAREKTLKVAQRLYEANLARFKQGRASANDLQVEQNRVIESELLAIQGWSKAHIALTKLCHSLGQSVRACGS